MPAASSPAPGASGAPARTGTPGATATGPAAVATSSGATRAPGTTAPTRGSARPAAPFRVAGTTTDSGGDAGTPTPYADLTAVTVEDDGWNARVTVRFAGDVPSRLPGDEVLGVGVDFYRSAAQLESDYQLFADGQPDGWYAYLHTPDGFVKYPGTFGVGGNRLVFTVPWNALGGPRSGTFSAFADWTRAATPTNLSGEDHAPDVGTAAYARS